MRAMATRRAGMTRKLKSSLVLYLFLLPAVAAIFIFNYIPMYGVQLAFKEYHFLKGITGSPWVGFQNFSRLFSTVQFWRILQNTLMISLYSLIAGFPMPIILALMLNSTMSMRLKRTVQLVTYAPHFISTVVMVGLIIQMLSPSSGPINAIIKLNGGTPVLFMGQPQTFYSIYVWSGIWQDVGWGSIIYIASLSGVDPELHEAATIDGASRFQRILYIDLPTIMPTATILLILSAGSIMNIGFEKVYLMQNPLNLSTSETISTYVYKVGLLNVDYPYASAVGLFNNAINFVLLILVNGVSRAMSGTSLF